MQDEIIPTFCRPRCGQFLRLLWSVSFCRWPEPERQNVVLIGGGQNVRHQQKEAAAHFAVTSQEDQDCKPGPWYNVADIFSATLPKIRSAFCISDFQRRILRLWTARSNVKCKMRSTSCGFERQIDARSCAVVGITPSHSTLIHHKRASRYVVLGEISNSPFTTYIFIINCKNILKTAEMRQSYYPSTL